MNAGIWIAVYMPLFILLFIILPQQRRIAWLKIKRKRGRQAMANELIKKYIGKNCTVSTGSFGTSASGLITAVEDNWIEISTKHGSRLINADFVTNISEIPAK